MAKRNTWEGFCGVCRCKVRALEGIVQDLGPGKGYRILAPSTSQPGRSTRLRRRRPPGCRRSTAATSITSGRADRCCGIATSRVRQRLFASGA